MIGSPELGGVYRRVRDRFRTAGLNTPEIDARLLISDVLNVESTGLLIDERRTVCSEQLQEIENRAAQRLNGMPVGRIIGRRGFWGFDLELNHATLEPRPDTETLIESVLDWLSAENRTEESLKILDIGTGSGAILIALLSELPAARGIGTEISPAAAFQAHRNLNSTAAGDRGNIVCCSYAEAVGKTFDIVVSNPPYIRSADIELLDPEVRQHDPVLALDGGVDGLTAYREIAQNLGSRMHEHGKLFVEIGYDQSCDVIDIFSAAGFGKANTFKDLSGHERVISVTPPELSH
ncbi:MAG: peptide chain release factor N(5)-glutamine methyltransferase [Stappiaceae bacterium]